MRRWNGWGDEQTHYPLPDSAAAYLAGRIGAGTAQPDATLQAVTQAAPPSRLSAADGVSLDATERTLHARGQSLPDWVALRSGQIGVYPDAVACPRSDEDIQRLFGYAQKTGARLIPYGGGTSVVGHINPLAGEAPTLTVDLSHMQRLLELDPTSRLAHFEAGVTGPELERQLAAHGYTLGHFPQSWELSTLGGWIASRSSGQQSYHYGRIEDLFAGGHVETPQGLLDLPCLPASAAGPDLRQMLLGSEGRLGIITRASVRVQPLPAQEAFYGIFFPDWDSGMAATRAIAQQGVPVSMARLSNGQETETTLRLSGKDALVAWAERGLGLLRFGPGRCLMILGVTGDRATCRHALSQARRIARQHGGLFTGQMAGKVWRKARFLSPYLRNTLWERGYAVDTLETALPWAKVPAAATETIATLQNALHAFNERALVFGHLSHLYADGASIYITYLFRRGDADETLTRWEALKTSATRTLLAHGGTISHQHGVGLDHAPYLVQEKGPLGMALLRANAATLDPQGMMNPGKLF